MLTDMRLYFATSFGHYNNNQWPLQIAVAIVQSLSSHPCHLVAAISRVDILSSLVIDFSRVCQVGCLCVGTTSVTNASVTLQA